MNRRCAFSLAEVLITLVIIGIVAVITIPNLISKYQAHQNYVMLKKYQSILANSYALIVKEEDTFDTWKLVNGLPASKVVANYIQRYVKVVKVCEEEVGCWSPTITKALNKKVIVTWGRLQGIGSGIVCMITADGVNMCVDMWDGGDIRNIFGVNTSLNYASSIWVDVNGNSGPNVVGRDVFAFVMTEKGLKPAGSDSNAQKCNPKDMSSTSGVQCAYKVIKELGIKY